MSWFKKKPAPPVDQAVVIHYALSDAAFGTSEEREAVYALESRLESIIDSLGSGEVDGHEFGGGEAVVYCYGPDADRLFAAIEQEVRAFPMRPAFVHLRYGAVDDPDAQEDRVHL